MAPFTPHAGLEPTLLDYVDALTMAAIIYNTQMELGIPDAAVSTPEGAK